MPTIAVDFDGVLHSYPSGWNGGEINGEPVEGAVEALQKIVTKGINVVVFTARDDLEPVKRWLADQGFWMMEVTNKKPIASMYIDDRAVRFTNWKDILNYF